MSGFAWSTSIKRVVIGQLLALLLLAVLAPTAIAEAPYEPNDAILSPAGPLANHQGYVAGLETENDKDFFFFYVTSPASPVTLTLTNLGGTGAVAYVGVAILDASGTPVGSLANIEEGETRSVSATLEPQKYFVEVISTLDYGAGYRLETQGGDGAFGAYATIGAHCAAAHRAGAKAKAGLTRAEAKRQRAKARVQRSLFGNPAERRTAQATYRKAKAQVVAKRDALSAARKSQKPWCFIAQ